jgi:hypothetical protein
LLKLDKDKTNGKTIIGNLYTEAGQIPNEQAKTNGIT